MAENGIHVSGRTVAAVLGIAAVIGATWGAATYLAAQTGRISTLESARSADSVRQLDVRRDDNLRWCRLERAVKIEPWHTCPAEPTP